MIVDAVISSFNEPVDKINLVLRSCLKQIKPFRNIYLVDDGSKETPVNANDLVGGNQIRLLRLEQNKGISVARNFAICQSDAEGIACINVDMFLEPNWLEATASCLNQQPNVGCVFTSMRPAKHTLLSAWRMRFHEEHYNIPSGEVTFAPGHAVLFKRSILFKVGGYNPVFKRVREDFDICEKMRQVGFTTYYLNMPLSVSYQSDTISYLTYKQVARLCGNHATIMSPLDFFKRSTNHFFIRISRNLAKGRFHFLGIDIIIYFKGFHCFKKFKETLSTGGEE